MDNTKDALRRSPALFYVIIAITIFSVFSNYARLSEQRWYRDFTRATPFHSVVLNNSALSEEGLLISGEMVKRRCAFQDLRAYLVFASGAQLPVKVNTSTEQVRWGGGDRAPSPNTQAWGAWLLEWSGATSPVSFDVYAIHQCPGEMIRQTNLFVHGSWVDYDIGVE